MIEPHKQFLRFLLIGLVNTVATYILYLFLLQFLHYSYAYTITFVVGVVLSYFLTSIFVFKAKLSIRKGISYPLVYLVQYLVGLLVLHICVKMLGLPAWFSGIVVVLVAVPITFVLSRFILSR